MDKDILVQYSDMKAEIKDIRQRIRNLEKDIGKLTIVSDSVKGTRQNGTYGNIMITGYPTEEYYRKKTALNKYLVLLQHKEAKLLELTSQAEEYIGNIKKSELRTMFRLYYIDNLTWVQVAHKMNVLYPKRRIKFTEDNCWRRDKRFFENVGSCREKKC